MRSSFRFVTVRRPGLTAAALASLGLVLLAATPRAQQATFRSSVDLIAVDTQVIGPSGEPVGALTAKDFHVWVNGQPRRVVSADLVQYPLTTPLLFSPNNGDRPAWITGDLPTVRGRIFVLAIDELSFDTASLQRAVAAARQFMGQLKPDDVVGVYPYPLGTSELNLTHYHGAANAQLDKLSALYEPFRGSFQLSPSEVVDLTARDSNAVNQVIARECPTFDPAGSRSLANRGSVSETNFIDPSCPTRLQSEANARGLFEEGQTTQSFLGLRELLNGLSDLPGPKSVVLLSAGMLMSDRVGGRPDVGSLLKSAGRDAAAADAMLYVLDFDDHLFDVYSAANVMPHRADDVFLSEARDSDTMALGLQEMAGEADGEYFRISTGNGRNAFDRVLTETSAYYLLGVQPENADRDGRTHFIRVTTAAKHATVHNRITVVVPKGSS